jgi:hypothetical protein
MEAQFPYRSHGKVVSRYTSLTEKPNREGMKGTGVSTNPDDARTEAM